MRLDERFAPTPSGLGVTVAWGMPYFERYVPGQAEKHLPVDRRATAARGEPVRVLEDAIRFPSDPETTQLEANDLAVVFRSDSLEHIAAGATALFVDLADLFRVTSIRKGFVGGGIGGRTGAAEADGDGRSGSREPSSSPTGRSCFSDLRLPRSRDSARRGSRTSKRSATPISGRAGTSSTERTCTSRICSRTSRPGTRSSTSRSAWTRPSGRASSPPRRRRRSHRA